MNRLFRSLALCLLISLPLTQSSYASGLTGNSSGAWGGQGEVSLQWRLFEGDKDPVSEEMGLAISSRVEVSYEKKVSKHVFRIQSRADERDQDRGFVALEDAYFSWLFGEEEDWKFLIGYKLFNWTSTEAFHPADVINSRHYDSDLENLDKLGELTFELEKSFENSTLSFYFFPRFERPRFPGDRSRLGTGSDLGTPLHFEGTEIGDRWVPQAAFFFSLTWQGMDLGIQAIRHVDRRFPIVGTSKYSFNPLLSTYVPNNPTALSTKPIPYYFNVTQFGLTLTKAFEACLLKIEAATREFEDEKSIYSAREMSLRKPVDHQDVAVGIEYALDFNPGSETSLIAEFGGIFGVNKETRKELTVFQRDALFGVRHAFNDAMGKEVFLSFITDIERKRERLYNLSYTQRLSDLFKMKTGIRLYDAPQKGPQAYGLEGFDGDNHIYFNLTRFF